MGDTLKREIERVTGKRPKDLSEQTTQEVVKAGIDALRKQKESQKQKEEG